MGVYMLVFGWVDNEIIRRSIKGIQEQYSKEFDALCEVNQVMVVSHPEIFVLVLETHSLFTTIEDATRVLHEKAKETDEEFAFMLKAVTFFWCLTELSKEHGIDDLETIGAPTWYLLQGEKL